MTGKEKESCNKFIHEKVFGLCWHNYKPDIFDDWECTKCGLSLSQGGENPNYLSDSDWYQVFKKAKESERWESFTDNPNVSIFDDIGNTFINIDLIGPAFPEAFARFLGWKYSKP